ncbi:MAG: PilZ domain-containing protein, partial [Candidatus Omnitrophica bacterium]|nr:PilZ domain-containing protein [Candidatus Omnitrophota bacterium]
IKAQETSDGIRIMISTSGPADFSSHWLDDPSRLVVEFQSRNILSKMDDEVIVDQGVIKRMTSSYFGRGKDRSLKSLTFELTQKVPYEIWQDENAILLDIETGSVGVSMFTIGDEEIVIEDTAKEAIIERLDAMDSALMLVAESQPTVETPPEPLEISTEGVIEEIPEVMDKAEAEVVLPKTVALPVDIPEALPTKEKKGIWGWALWLAGLTLVSGLGSLAWYRRRPKIEIDEKLKKLKIELQEKDNRLKQEETVRKAVEKTSLEKEKERKQLQSILQERNNQLKEEKAIRETAEKVLSQKEEEQKRLRLELQKNGNRLKEEEAGRETIRKSALEKDEVLKKLKLELQKKDNRLKEEKGIHETAEKAVLEKEEESKKLKLVLQESNNKLGQEKFARETVEKAVLEKEGEYKKLKTSYESLENTLIKKELAKKLLSLEGEKRLWISGKSQEKRTFPRLSLTKDFKKTIVLRIESPNKPHLRSFAKDVSSKGLCFEAEREFDEKEPVNLRLFFFGDRVPMIKAQARIIWKRKVGQVNYYGVSFDLLEEKDKLELSQYIKSKINEPIMEEVAVEV